MLLRRRSCPKPVCPNPGGPARTSRPRRAPGSYRAPPVPGPRPARGAGSLRLDHVPTTIDEPLVLEQAPAISFDPDRVPLLEALRVGFPDAARHVDLLMALQLEDLVPRELGIDDVRHHALDKHVFAVVPVP